MGCTSGSCIFGGMAGCCGCIPHPLHPDHVDMSGIVGHWGRGRGHLDLHSRLSSSLSNESLDLCLVCLFSCIFFIFFFELLYLIYWIVNEIPNPKKRPRKNDPLLIWLSISQLNSPTLVEDSEFWLRSPQILVSHEPCMSRGHTRLTAEF